MRSPAAAIASTASHSLRAGDPLLRLVRRKLREAAAPDEWSVQPRAGPEESWTYVRHAAAQEPAQGWKLHATATVWSAAEMLERALPVLLSEASSFKFASSTEVLHRLNRGELGRSQVGKFITVYPGSEAQAVRLGERLHEATAGLRGPRVPTDRLLRSGSAISYRYGDFLGQELRRLTGETVPAIATPDGELIADERSTFYRAPPWAEDPFRDSPPPPAPLEPGVLIGGRLLVVAVLAELPRGSTVLAADLAGDRRCVLKTAEKDSYIDREGADARDYLRREAAMLALLADDGRFPGVHSLFEENGLLILEMEDFAGEALDEHVARRAAEGNLLDGAEVVRIGMLVASSLDSLHARGIAHRDVKAANLIRAPDGGIRLVDFGLAHPIGDGVSRGGLGTRGYRSECDEPVKEDIFATGALLYHLATGAEPARAPDGRPLLARPVRLMNPRVGAGLEQVIAKCLAAPDIRFGDARSLAAALAAAEPRTAPVARATASRRTKKDSLHYAEAARRLGGTLRAAMGAESAPSGEWVDTADPQRGTDLHLGAGTAGAVLALVELASRFGEFEAAALAAARALAARPRPAPRLPGLYVGEAGIGAALLRGGQLLGDAGLVEEAARLSEWIARQPHRSPDLYVGSAGRLRFHLLLWDETGRPEALAAAVEAGRVLIGGARAVGDGAICWDIPPGYEQMSGNAYLGYGHGAAGIADALLDLFDAVGSAEFLDAVTAAARWVAMNASATLPDGSGLGWPSAAGGPPSGAYWCHGACGIGGFLLRAGASGAVAGASELAVRAARTVASGTRWLNPTQCHGLAGSIELLIDMYQTTRDRFWLEQAREIGQLLDAFACEKDGRPVFPSESPMSFAPAYLTGYAGIAPCLLRLAEPETRPRQLSRAGFRHCPAESFRRSGRPSGPIGRPATVVAGPADPLR